MYKRQCEVLVEQNTYDELEEPAADLVAAATRLRDPVLLLSLIHISEPTRPY